MSTDSSGTVASTGTVATPGPIEIIGRDRAVVVFRAEQIPDAGALVSALVDGGIHGIEFTFTTPDVERHVRAAIAADTGAAIGVGTVLTAAQAERAISAGAEFLVTPGVVGEVGRVATETGTPLAMGAFTPTEVIAAVDHGATAVKIFPAQSAGARHFSHLRGPLPDVRLIASGGIDESNARSFLDAGAYAVTAGSSVVTSRLVAAEDYAEITRRARAFMASLDAPPQS